MLFGLHTIAARYIVKHLCTHQRKRKNNTVVLMFLQFKQNTKHLGYKKQKSILKLMVLHLH